MKTFRRYAKDPRDAQKTATCLLRILNYADGIMPENATAKIDG
jgi:hypothetical protein